jgi:hypothetical protein
MLLAVTPTVTVLINRPCPNATPSGFVKLVLRLCREHFDDV